MLSLVISGCSHIKEVKEILIIKRGDQSLISDTNSIRPLEPSLIFHSKLNRNLYFELMRNPFKKIERIK